MLNLRDCSINDVDCLLEAADEVLDCLRVMGKAGTNPVAQILAHQGQFVELEHYPAGDVHDLESGSQYYYHAHRPEEHGHFHTFLRTDHLPDPIRTEHAESPGVDEEGITHLVGVSMNSIGLPTSLFTTNQWVTGETYSSADKVASMLECFDVDHTFPCHATNRWISALLRLFRPQIVYLLHQRDMKLSLWRRTYPNVNAFEDRRLEITSEMDIDIDVQIAAIDEMKDRK